MDLVANYWHQILLLLTAVIVAVRLESEVKSLRKDVDSLSEELCRRDTYVEVVKHRSEIDVLNKQVSSLWDYVNMLRNKFRNGEDK